MQKKGPEAFHEVHLDHPAPSQLSGVSQAPYWLGGGSSPTTGVKVAKVQLAGIQVPPGPARAPHLKVIIRRDKSTLRG